MTTHSNKNQLHFNAEYYFHNKLVVRLYNEIVFCVKLTKMKCCSPGREKTLKMSFTRTFI